ncbi:holo-ACP synthase [Aeromicrobium sp. Leaf350]|uniref:holo-ACP synthase AcpS n=1 Tax=Aeromicrobium sp. Leaf350 TaxID=2876565 RepID=UPI001E2A7FE7|nr:holo-ACP synthase [Aeromicrobium sp. Leaf350]
MTVLGVGVDLVHVPGFAAQLAQPGTRFADAFTPGERADAAERADPDASLAARWAAKEAVVKAWSAALYGSPPVMPEGVHRRIEVVADAWGRPAVRLLGDVAAAAASSLGVGSADLTWHLSLSHDADYATAYVTLTT